jgi:hypothetical protein
VSQNVISNLETAIAMGNPDRDGWFGKIPFFLKQ